jgi:hypothetical protein
MINQFKRPPNLRPSYSLRRLSYSLPLHPRLFVSKVKNQPRARCEEQYACHPREGLFYLFISTRFPITRGRNTRESCIRGVEGGQNTYTRFVPRPLFLHRFILFPTRGTEHPPFQSQSQTHLYPRPPIRLPITPLRIRTQSRTLCACKQVFCIRS